MWWGFLDGWRWGVGGFLVDGLKAGWLDDWRL